MPAFALALFMVETGAVALAAVTSQGVELAVLPG
jgi:hypothetical protein